jgi:hypothetical protein
MRSLILTIDPGHVVERSEVDIAIARAGVNRHGASTRSCRRRRTGLEGLLTLLGLIDRLP